jgi:hypothetical protein
MSYFYPGYNNYSCTTTGNCIPNPNGEFSDLMTCQQACSNYLSPFSYNPYNDPWYGYNNYGYIQPIYYGPFMYPYRTLGGGYPYHGRNYSKFVGRGGNWPGGGRNWSGGRSSGSSGRGSGGRGGGGRR